MASGTRVSLPLAAKYEYNSLFGFRTLSGGCGRLTLFYENLFRHTCTQLLWVLATL
jgi:hypothetical protein